MNDPILDFFRDCHYTPVIALAGVALFLFNILLLMVLACGPRNKSKEVSREPVKARPHWYK